MLIRDDGSLWTWGLNYFGELGDGSYNTAYAPEQIVPSGVTAIAAGGYHSMFISNSNLYTMGNNQYGQLAFTDLVNVYSPSNVDFTTLSSPPSFVTTIAAGALNSLSLINVKGFTNLPTAVGDNTFGQTGGVGDIPGQEYAVELEFLLTRSTNNVTAIAAGGAHTLFIASDGSLWGQGDNEFGQLGNPNYVNTKQTLPILIPTLPPPQLDINSYSNQPVLIFTPSATNYVLQMTTNLASPNWVTASNYVPMNAVLFTNAPANAFFRFH
jgi:hypothetical protein